MQRSEWRAFRAREKRISWSEWIAVLLVATGGAIGVGYLWSFLAGTLLAIAVASTGFEIGRRRSKARWLARFPNSPGPSGPVAKTQTDPLPSRA